MKSASRVLLIVVVVVVALVLGVRAWLDQELSNAAPGARSETEERTNAQRDARAENATLERDEALARARASDDGAPIAQGERASARPSSGPPTPVRIVATWPNGTRAHGVRIEARVAPPATPQRREELVTLWDGTSIESRTIEVFGDPLLVAKPVSGNTDARGVLDLEFPLADKWSFHAETTRPIEREALVAVPPDVLELARGRDVVWRAEAYGAGAVPAEVRLTLALRPVVVVRTLDAHGAPIAGAKVVLFGAAKRAAEDDPMRGLDLSGRGWDPDWDSPVKSTDDPFPRELARVTSDELGVAFAADVDVEPNTDALELVVSAGAERTFEVSHVRPTTSFTRVDVVLRRTSVLAGIVRDGSGAPRGFAHVSCDWSGETRALDAAPPGSSARTAADRRRGRELGGRSRTVVTDEAGRFRIEFVQPGWSRLVPVSAHGVPSPPLDVLVKPAEDQLDLELFVRDGATIDGRVLGPNGERLAARVVTCTFETERMRRARERAEAKKAEDDAAREAGRARSGSSSDAVDGAADARSTISAADDGSATDADVLAHSEDAARAGVFTATTDAGGAFRFEHLTPGRWIVHVEGAPADVATEARELGEGAHVRIELRLGG